MSHYKNAIHAAVKALEAKHGKIGFSIRVYDYSKYILNIHSLSVDVMENALEHSAAVMERLDRARDSKAYAKKVKEDAVKACNEIFANRQQGNLIEYTSENVVSLMPAYAAANTLH